MDTPLDRDPPWTEIHPRQRPLWTKTPGQRPPQTETPMDRDPPGQKLPWTETPLDRDPSPGQRPPWTETPDMLTSGWYASYCNAFLSNLNVGIEFGCKVWICSCPMTVTLHRCTGPTTQNWHECQPIIWLFLKNSNILISRFYIIMLSVFLSSAISYYMTHILLLLSK